MTSPASADSVTAALIKSLPGARLHRIPRHPQRRDIVLAVLCLGLQRRLPYTELELNELLQSALESLNATVDHVTCRRYLVDCGFIKRDRAGQRYFLNWPKLESTLSSDAMDSAAALVRAALHSQSARARKSKPAD